MCSIVAVVVVLYAYMYINVRVNLTGAKLQFMQQLYRLDWLILRFIGLYYYYMYIECALLFPFYYVSERVCVCMLFCVFFFVKFPIIQCITLLIERSQPHTYTTRLRIQFDKVKTFDWIGWTTNLFFGTMKSGWKSCTSHSYIRFSLCSRGVYVTKWDCIGIRYSTDMLSQIVNVCVRVLFLAIPHCVVCVCIEWIVYMYTSNE